MRLIRVAAALGIATMWLSFGFLAVRAEPDLEPCTLIPPGFSIDTTAEGPSGFPWCAFAQELDGDNSVSVIVAHFGSRDSAQASVQQEINDNPGNWALTTLWGDVAYEATGDFLGVPAHSATFARNGWLVRSFSCCPSTSNTYAALAYIDALLQGAAAPSIDPSPSTAPSASGSPGPMTIGMGCATDVRYVRCTVSVYGARPDADLLYDWRFDGQDRPETGSTMQIDWLTEGIAEGFHTVGLDVRDVRNGIGPVGDVTSFVLGASVAPPAVDDALKGAAAVAITTGVAVGLATAAKGQGGPSAAPSSDPFADAADLLGKESTARSGQTGNSLLPHPYDTRGWRNLVPWPPDNEKGFMEAWTNCYREFSGDRQGMLACLRSHSAEAWTTMPRPPTTPAPPADPGAAAADLLGADAGDLPPLNTPADGEKWKALAGWPEGPEAHQYFLNAIGNTPEMTPAQRLAFLRGEAARIRALLKNAPPSPSPPPAPASPAAPPSPKPFDPTDVLNDDFNP